MMSIAKWGLASDDDDIESRTDFMEPFDTTTVSTLIDTVNELKQARKRKMKKVAEKGECMANGNVGENPPVKCQGLLRMQWHVFIRLCTNCMSRIT